MAVLVTTCSSSRSPLRTRPAARVEERLPKNACALASIPHTGRPHSPFKRAFARPVNRPSLCRVVMRYSCCACGVREAMERSASGLPHHPGARLRLPRSRRTVVISHSKGSQACSAWRVCCGGIGFCGDVHLQASPGAVREREAAAVHTCHACSVECGCRSGPHAGS